MEHMLNLPPEGHRCSVDHCFGTNDLSHTSHGRDGAVSHGDQDLIAQLAQEVTGRNRSTPKQAMSSWQGRLSRLGLELAKVTAFWSPRTCARLNSCSLSRYRRLGLPSHPSHDPNPGIAFKRVWAHHRWTAPCATSSCSFSAGNPQSASARWTHCCTPSLMRCRQSATCCRCSSQCHPLMRSSSMPPRSSLHAFPAHILFASLDSEPNQPYCCSEVPRKQAA